MSENKKVIDYSGGELDPNIIVNEKDGKKTTLAELLKTSKDKSGLFKDDKKIISLYDYFKNTPKKLKIVCDWDEVIQNCEQYAGWKAFKELSHLFRGGFHHILEEHFKDFWDTNLIEYSPYSSKIGEVNFHSKEHLNKYLEIKNSPNFYQQAPFLTIAEDLLKLIKEDKIEKLIFLSAYDKRKFPNGDPRKVLIVENTFSGIGGIENTPANSFRQINDLWSWKRKNFSLDLQLIPFESEIQGQSKADWIKQNASDFDLVIDDNPNICRKLKEPIWSDWISKELVIESLEKNPCIFCNKKVSFKNLAGFDHEYNSPFEISSPFCSKCQVEHEVAIEKNRHSYSYLNTYLKENKFTVLAPYYPAIESQHHSEVLLIKNEVSNLKKEDFSK